MKAFLITFDPLYTNITGAHSAITGSPFVLDWWHYMSGTYIVVTSQPIQLLDIDIKTRWPGGWLLIIEVKKPSTGLLSPEAWQWINSKIPS